jgi:predicted ATPase
MNRDSIHLRSIELDPAVKEEMDFPFNLPFVRKFRRLEFKQQVTFLVGENGSGKSTFLECLGYAAELLNIGAIELDRDPTLIAQRRLGDTMKLQWRRRTHRGFFLRAEDFFNFATRIGRGWRELEAIEQEMEDSMVGDVLTRARGPVQGQRRSFTERYGGDVDARSHGESFLNFFRERLVPGGVYLLDEPEAPLSPQRQLAFLSLLKEMVEQDSQFIIATHSPLIMAFPDAAIYSFDHAPIKKVKYEEVEHVALTKAFLDNPEAFLRRL